MWSSQIGRLPFSYCKMYLPHSATRVISNFNIYSSRTLTVLILLFPCSLVSYLKHGCARGRCARDLLSNHPCLGPRAAWPPISYLYQPWILTIDIMYSPQLWLLPVAELTLSPPAHQAQARHKMATIWTFKKDFTNGAWHAIKYPNTTWIQGYNCIVAFFYILYNLCPLFPLTESRRCQVLTPIHELTS